MQTLVGGSRTVSRLFHLALGATAVAFAAVSVWAAITPGNLVFATVVGVFGVYNLLGTLFPAAVVFPTAGPEADRTVYRLVHAAGVVFFFAVAAAAYWRLELTPLALLAALVGVYDLIGIALPGLYPAMAMVYGVNRL